MASCHMVRYGADLNPRPFRWTGFSFVYNDAMPMINCCCGGCPACVHGEDWDAAIAAATAYLPEPSLVVRIREVPEITDGPIVLCCGADNGSTYSFTPTLNETLSGKLATLKCNTEGFMWDFEAGITYPLMISEPIVASVSMVKTSGDCSVSAVTFADVRLAYFQNEFGDGAISLVSKSYHHTDSFRLTLLGFWECDYFGSSPGSHFAFSFDVNGVDFVGGDCPGLVSYSPTGEGNHLPVNDGNHCWSFSPGPSSPPDCYTMGTVVQPRESFCSVGFAAYYYELTRCFDNSVFKARSMDLITTCFASSSCSPAYIITQLAADSGPEYYSVLRSRFDCEVTENIGEYTVTDACPASDNYYDLTPCNPGYGQSSIKIKTSNAALDGDTILTQLPGDSEAFCYVCAVTSNPDFAIDSPPLTLLDDCSNTLCPPRPCLFVVFRQCGSTNTEGHCLLDPPSVDSVWKNPSLGIFFFVESVTTTTLCTSADPCNVMADLEFTAHAGTCPRVFTLTPCNPFMSTWVVYVEDDSLVSGSTILTDVGEGMEAYTATLGGTPPSFAPTFGSYTVIGGCP